MSVVQDESVALGKRSRSHSPSEDGPEAPRNQRSHVDDGVDDGDDDDEVGPMPMPAEAASEVPKKKRKGMFVVHCVLAAFLWLIIPI